MRKSVRTVFVGKIRHVEVIKEGEATDGHGKEWRKDDTFWDRAAQDMMITFWDKAGPTRQGGW